ncbi:DUF4870 domain-containing protein [Agrococcus sp. SL85]|uniref:DUF4870 domain-containing protein n=1 Tax=Agrococcus sp. SL85 TaxID=2995141 RepID=UPI00226D348A|nr:DUF4870 domain-containing protein [Agrococcus sp. SL85]WAC65708.1 DUF4870 domain-containing protein [Agrococcus sp. SL85]
MSDPNAPRREDQPDPAAQPGDGFSVTHEQHAAPSAPAAPGVGQPAQPFTGHSPDAAAGNPAFSAPPADGQGRQQPQQPSAPAAPPYGAPQGEHGAPSHGVPPHGAPPQYGAPQGHQPPQGAYPPAGGYPPPQGGQYGAPGQPQYASAPPMSPVDEKNAGMWGHLSGLSTIVTGGFGGWIGPLIVFMIYKDRSAFAKQEAREALNFGIFSAILAIGILIVGTITSVIGIGFLLLGIYWVPALVQVIFSIIGAVRVNGGGSYRYPFNWRLVK